MLASGVNATNLVVAGMSFWSDANRLTLGDADANGQIALFDFDAGEILHRAIRVGAQRILCGHSEPCVRLGISPDGAFLFSGSHDGSTRLWDAALGQTIMSAHDVPSPQRGFDASFELLRTTRKTSAQLAMNASPTRSCNMASQPPTTIFELLSMSGRRARTKKTGDHRWSPWRILQSNRSGQALASVAAGLFFSAALATFTISTNAALSCAAMSARIFRSSSHLAAFNPSISRL